MIEPAIVLAGMRRELRDVVLPAVEDESVRASVVAMIGILGELSGRVRSDERWHAASVRDLEAGCERWAAALGAGAPAGRQLLELRERAGGVASPSGARELLLTAACRAVSAGDAAVRADVRRVLAADLSRQLPESAS